MQSAPRAYVTGLGVICAGANNVAELRALLAHPQPRFHPATVFPVHGESASLPVAEVASNAVQARDVPRTHQLALAAAREAVGTGPAPDAIVLGSTTGGILVTESALAAKVAAPEAYRFHGLDTVGQYLANTLHVSGPVLTTSTACSSATVALWVAHALLRAGLARRVLVGGADSLCRLTFHGFRQLQLIAPGGARPLDAQRAGMTVGEGAGFLVLESNPEHRFVLAALAGTGLSCDAYHATTPHPEGVGAVLAIERALEEAGLSTSAIDYVNLHGTGTPDNDAAEARALKAVFQDRLPALSSTKGLTGHALAAAGAVEAVISVLTLCDGLLPANTGLELLDPKLGLSPVLRPTSAAPRTVLSNSFGFGGNNACAVFEKAAVPSALPMVSPQRMPALRVATAASLCARGVLGESWDALALGEPTTGLVPDAAFNQAVPAAYARRLKRLPRMVLALAEAVQRESGGSEADFIAFGTAWGPLAETQSFLRKLFDSGDQFSSPTDFIGSVHNAPAGQVALLRGLRSPNLTCSSGDRSFEQSLLCASLAIASGAAKALVLAAEAFEPTLSPLLDPLGAAPPRASDGGAAFLVVPDDGKPGTRLRWLGESGGGADSVLRLVDRLAGDASLADYDAVAVDVPCAFAAEAARILPKLANRFTRAPVVSYRDQLGHHASVSATAAALAVHSLPAGALPFAPTPIPLPRRRLLMLQVGLRASAIEVFHAP
jgi:3-oxoacyl-(acyl-carrier-protein) synthase